MDMRLRFPELLADRGLSAYALAQSSDGRISLSAAYRLNRKRGRLGYFDADLLEALCDVLGVGPGDLFEREKREAAPKGARPVKAAAKSAAKPTTKLAARKRGARA